MLDRLIWLIGLASLTSQRLERWYGCCPISIGHEPKVGGVGEVDWIVPRDRLRLMGVDTSDDEPKVA